MSGHMVGGMSDLTIPPFDPEPTQMLNSGLVKNRWSACVICGNPTSQPPVCFDLRCELERYGEEA